MEKQSKHKDEDSIKPLKYYKNPFYLTCIVALVAFVFTYLGITDNNQYSIISILVVIMAGILAFFMYKSQCPHCKRVFIKKEDKDKEVDLGVRNIERKYLSAVKKTRSGEVIEEIHSKKSWPARFVQRFFYCKKCGYGKNNEWKDDEKGIFKRYENEDKWQMSLPVPKVIYVKENKDGDYVKVDKNIHSKKFYPYPRINPNKALKKEVMERAKYKCQMCGEHDALDIHHINGKRDETTLKNLIVFCPTCHRKAEKGIWKKEKLIHDSQYAFSGSKEIKINQG